MKTVQNILKYTYLGTLLLNSLFLVTILTVALVLVTEGVRIQWGFLSEL